VGVAEATAVAVVLFMGALTRSVFGFGDAAVAMPLLALLGLRVTAAVPLVGLAGMVVAGTALLSGWRSADRRTLAWLSVSTVLGVPLGVLLVTRVPEDLVTRSLGVLLIAYGLHGLRRPVRPRARGGAGVVVSGLAAGLLGSAYNLNGVPVALYGAGRGWSAARFRGTLQAHFVVSSVLVVGGQGIGGLWSADVFELLLVALPGILLAVPIGTALHRRIREAHFARGVHAAIVLLGVLLLP